MTMPPPPPGGYGPPPPGGGYGQPPVGPPAGGPPPIGPPPMGGGPYGGAPRPNNDTPKTLGILGLISGIVGIPASCCCWPIGMLFAIGALIMGGVGFSQVKDDPHSDAKPFLIAALALGAIAVVLAILSIVFGVASLLVDGNDF